MPKSQAQNDFILKKARELVGDAGWDNIWLGISDDQQEGTWVDIYTGKGNTKNKRLLISNKKYLSIKFNSLSPIKRQRNKL